MWRISHCFLRQKPGYLAGQTILFDGGQSILAQRSPYDMAFGSELHASEAARAVFAARRRYPVQAVRSYTNFIAVILGRRIAARKQFGKYLVFECCGGSMKVWNFAT